jgi:hypothetical protein
MIRVVVLIDEHVNMNVHAVREPEVGGDASHPTYGVYITSGQRPLVDEHVKIGTIKHKDSLGAAQLAVRMLKMYNRHIERREASKNA